MVGGPPRPRARDGAGRVQDSRARSRAESTRPAITPESLRTFDDEVRSVFDADRLITPDDVRGDHDSLEAAVLDGDWPTVDDARGRVMFVLNDHRDEYVDGDPSLAGRVAFPNSTPGEPDAAFLLLNDPIEDAEEIAAAVESGYIVRTRADVPVATVRSGDTTQRDAAFASGAQFVSTDFPVAGLSLRWGTEYVAQLPGGGTARCNPVTAPPDCDSRPSKISRLDRHRPTPLTPSGVRRGRRRVDSSAAASLLAPPPARGLPPLSTPTERTADASRQSPAQVARPRSYGDARPGWTGTTRAVTP